MTVDRPCAWRPSASLRVFLVALALAGVAALTSIVAAA